MSEIKDIALRVIVEESEALRLLTQFINDDFERVVHLIYGCRGRVVVTGIGKSAIIGQKIVATFNSTGTPSVFMHAADAIHGDLGMVQKDDIVIFLSNSGNTPEIKMLVPLVKNLGNENIVAMVSNQDSFLAQNAKYVLNAHVDREVCPLNLAPTTSTTIQLVMGDALAVCLMRCRNFSSSDFARYHPGGALGKRLLTRVSDVFSLTKRPSVFPDDDIRKVITEMSGGCLGAVVVLDREDRLLGVITDGDLRRMLGRYKEIDTVKAGDIMTRSPKTVRADELAYTAFLQMEKNSITQLVVVDEDGHCLGIVHIHDILKEGVV